MCGIAGILSHTHTENLDKTVTKMLDQLNHRGSDDRGIWRDQRACIGHNRLSIIAPEDGHQPFVSDNSDIVLACNGEIFNHRELRAELEAKGHRFNTHSDCEVILHLYREEGIRCLKKLNGQFAFSLLDRRNDTLYLARDRVGILPLFYHQSPENFIFASEVKGLLPVTGRPTLDTSSLEETFTFWAPLSGNTMFRGIEEVKPGHYLEFKANAHASHQYWDWEFPDSDDLIRDEKAALEVFAELFADSIKIRLQADVPVATFLSGGLDSSAVTAVSARFNHKISTHSLRFPSSETHDESEYQRIVSEGIGLPNTAVEINNSTISQHFSDTIWSTETPILRAAPTPLKRLASGTKNAGYTVVLTGEGADEILAGYDLFKETKVRKFWAKQPESTCRPRLLEKLYPYMQNELSQSSFYLKQFFGKGLEQHNHQFFSHLPRWETTRACQLFFSEDLKSNLGEDQALDRLVNLLPNSFDSWHWLHKAQYLEAHTLLSNYLLPSQSDRMLMSFALEGRYPFLDHRLIEFCNQLHPSLKIKGLNEKWLLKKASQEFLPDSITKRHKQPFRAPDSTSFSEQPLPEELEYVLSESSIKKYGYFDPKKAGLLLKKIRSGNRHRQSDSMALVGIISTQLWHKHFIEDYNNNFRSV